MIDAILENRTINMLARGFQRSPSQVNKLHETDAELLRFGPGTYLAVTVDTLAEEIASGLYSDPHLIGWMAVMANMSDLAAVGAQPMGILISELLPPNSSQSYLRRLQEGIEHACTACGTFVLGGDTNTGAQLIITGCALGIVNSMEKPPGRLGCRPGDALYATGPLGTGNAFALTQFANDGPGNFIYRPFARLKEGQMISQFATSRMDTSDGALATLDQLMRLNHVGFHLDKYWKDALSEEAAATAQAHGIPPWLLLAGQHGEFELLFTIPGDKEHLFLESSAAGHWQPIRLGNVIDDPVITLRLYGDEVHLDTAMIRNLGNSGADDIQTYIQRLLMLDQEIEKGTYSYGNE